MINVGNQLNLDFEVKAVVDGEHWKGRFIDLISRPTFVSVYMRNNTATCDRQTQQLQEVAEELHRLGFGVIGLSKDTPGAHLKYCGKRNLEIPLVSDPEHKFARSTDSLVEKRLYGNSFLGPTRSAYLIDEGGILRGVITTIDAGSHGEQLLEMARVGE